jgi:hypothetical protein
MGSLVLRALSRKERRASFAMRRASERVFAQRADFRNGRDDNFATTFRHPMIAHALHTLSCHASLGPALSCWNAFAK